jgi:hypothetical protein
MTPGAADVIVTETEIILNQETIYSRSGITEQAAEELDKLHTMSQNGDLIIRFLQLLTQKR